MMILLPCAAHQPTKLAPHLTLPPKITPDQDPHLYTKNYYPLTKINQKVRVISYTKQKNEPMVQ